MTWKSKGFLSLLAAVLLGIMGFCVWNNQSAFEGSIVKNADRYSLEFEKMNQEDSHVISACKGDVFSVNYKIENGHVDILIAIDGNAPIYKGNRIETGAFDVIIPEDGEYRVTINASHAAGFVEVFMTKE